jgi:hypothetical protein
MSNRCLFGTLVLAASLSAHAAQPKVAVRAAPSSVGWSSAHWLPFHPNRFLTAALTADGTPYDVLQGTDIAGGSLLDGASTPKYPILVSLSTESVSDAEATAIRNYVQAGGTVYVSGAAWTRYENGTPRLDANQNPRFALGTEMGLDAAGWITIDRARVQNIGPMNDHLDLGQTYPWALTYAYDDQNGLQAAHTVYGARSNGATVSMTGLAQTGIAPSVPSTPLPAGSWNDPQFAVAYGNVDGDPAGRVDLVYRIGQNVYVRLSNGRGFDPPGPPNYWSPSYDFRIADVNGDGKADIIGRSGFDVQVGLSTGTSFAMSTMWTHWQSIYDYRLADVNGDGRADMVGRSTTLGDIQVALSSGAGFYGSTAWSAHDGATDVQLADVDGDGNADLVYEKNGFVKVQRAEPAFAGGPRFAPPVNWSAWSSGTRLIVGDVDGDGKADAIGHAPSSAIVVGLSNGSAFATPTTWTAWNLLAPPTTADVNGDGRGDLVGCYCDSSPAVPAPGEIHTGFSTGLDPSVSSEFAALSRKTYGNGVFVYNAEVVPLAGYGGFANDNSQYKTIRRTIEQAFAKRELPLTTLSPWPYPHRAAMIYRHDHWIANDIHAYEQTFASPGQKFGEYYVLPEQANATTCTGGTPWTNHYPSGVNAAFAATAVLGAHTTGHVIMDGYDYAGAVTKLNQTKALIEQATPGRMSPAFVAPAYFAIKQSTLQAIWDTGFVTTGEIGVGPFPHFTMNPTAATGNIGSLLQLPTSEWPGYDNVERMIMALPATNLMNKAAKLAFDLGGLINVYDHAAGDMYGYGALPPGDECGFSRYQLAKGLLDYVQSLDNGRVQRIWRTNSLDIRNWRLQRDRHDVQPGVTRTATTTRIDATIAATAPMAPTPFVEDDTALRIALDATSQAHAQVRTQVTLRRAGVPDVVANCTNNATVSCLGDVMLVKIGNATSATIELGQ